MREAAEATGAVHLSTFVGYLGGGPFGAVVIAIGIFLPAFAFSLIGHDALEGLVHQPRIRLFLEGVTAGAIGLIAGTTLALLKVSLTGREAVILERTFPATITLIIFEI